MAKAVKKIVKPGFVRKKYCRLCRNKVKEIDYKEVDFLQRFISERGKILSTRISGNCAKHQRKVSQAIKRARIMALLPFMGE
ncbi:MAG: 30S ribosomal protein S18 [Candidatus Omnitrophica bacterium]|nr:30S ribosomal protein S18 [Candidatus Omnitrophota bacterium]MCM8793109.1 30S ribosomal protein S18 [Candidatus Omnitrophota bacterium]